jgi:quinol monooxygenase YgiN
MVTLLIHHRVADYEAWRSVYDRVTAGPMGERVRSHQLWRGLDDQQLVVVVETYDSREDAEWSMNHPDLPAALAEAGVEMESVRIDYLEEVGSG